MSDRRLHMPDSICRFVLNFELVDGEPAICTMYQHHDTDTDPLLSGIFGTGATYDDTIADEQAAKLAAAWVGNWQALQGGDTKLVSIDWAWNAAVPGGPLHEGTYTGDPLPLVGASGAHSLSNSLAICCREGTGLGGRSNHGRFFVPGIGTANADSADPNRISDASFAAAQTVASGFLDGWNNNNLIAGIGDVFQMCVTSFIHVGAERTTAVSAKVTKCDVRLPFFSFQQRRAPLHNRHRA